ncbi:aflO/ omtB/ dmtA/ O-methyltransferase B [Apiospora arundinis]
MDPVGCIVPITRPDPRKTIRMQGDDDTDENSSKPPFRFMDLPPELRQAVLEETDLVTPCREVQWRPSQGFSVTLPITVLCKSTYDERVVFHETGSRDTRQAWRHQCAFGCQQMQSDRIRLASPPIGGLPLRCSCSWTSPRGLMSVSRAFYREAVDTLYRCNRVIVLPRRDGAGLFDAPAPRSGASWLEEEEPRLDASRFLAANAAAGYPAALSQLRTLEVVFPDLGLQGPPPRDQQAQRAHLCQDWCAALRGLLEQQQQQQTKTTKEDEGWLARLTVIVHMEVFAHGAPYMRVGNCKPDGYRSMFGRMRKPAHRRYGTPLYTDTDFVRGHADLLAPLRELRAGGLRRLFVFLEPNWHWSPRRGVAPYEGRYQDQVALDGVVVEMEKGLERGVMGDDYESAAEGKMEEFPSQWMLARRAKHRDTVSNPLRLLQDPI